MTARRSLRRHARREPLSEAQREFLRSGVEGAAVSTLDEHLARRGEALRRAWRLHRAEVLPDFVSAHPGRRPWAWWRYDAPEPSRRRLGGVGTPKHEVLAYAARVDYGIPVYWVDSWEVAYYNGRARDVHGRPIGTEYHEGHFRGVAIDPADPPRFESEAEYLDRHDMLSAAERAALPPDAFEHEVVNPFHKEKSP